jgi:hypothetical protein
MRISTLGAGLVLTVATLTGCADMGDDRDCTTIYTVAHQAPAPRPAPALRPNLTKPTAPKAPPRVQPAPPKPIATPTNPPNTGPHPHLICTD